MANIKQIVVNNFSYPFSGSNYLSINSNGVINVNAAEIYGTTYDGNYLISLSYLTDYVDAALASITPGGGEGETTNWLSSDSITPNYTTQKLNVNKQWVISTVLKDGDWNNISVSNQSKLSSMISNWGFRTAETDDNWKYGVKENGGLGLTGSTNSTRQFYVDTDWLGTQLTTNVSGLVKNYLLSVDTPHTAGEVLKINGNNDGFEWGEAGISEVNLSDVASDASAGSVIVVGSNGKLTASNDTYPLSTVASIYDIVKQIIKIDTANSHAGFTLDPNATAHTLTFTDTGDGSGSSSGGQQYTSLDTKVITVNNNSFKIGITAGTAAGQILSTMNNGGTLSAVWGTPNFLTAGDLYSSTKKLDASSISSATKPGYFKFDSYGNALIVNQTYLTTASSLNADKLTGKADISILSGNNSNNGLLKINNGSVDVDSTAYITTASLTQANIYSAVKAILQGSNTVTISPSDPNKTLTLTASDGGSSGGGAAYDSLIAILVDGENSSVSGNGTDKIAINVDLSQVSDTDTWYKYVAGSDNSLSFGTQSKSDATHANDVTISVSETWLTGKISEYLTTNNYTDETDISGLVKDYLSGITGHGANKVLKINSSNNNFEWGEAGITSVGLSDVSGIAADNGKVIIMGKQGDSYYLSASSDTYLKNGATIDITDLDTSTATAAGQVLMYDSGTVKWMSITTPGEEGGSAEYTTDQPTIISINNNAHKLNLAAGTVGQVLKTTAVGVVQWAADDNDHMSTYIYVGSNWNGSGTPANSTSDVTDPYIFLAEKYNNAYTKTNYIQIQAGTDIQVKAKNGIITIGFTNSSGYKTTDHDHTYGQGSLSSLTFTAGTGQTSTIDVDTTWLNNWLTNNNYKTTDHTYSRGSLSSLTFTAGTNQNSTVDVNTTWLTNWLTTNNYKTTDHDHTYSRGSLSSLTFTAGTGQASTIDVNTTWLANWLTTNNYKTEDHDHTYSNGDTSLTFTPGSNETTTVVVNPAWLSGHGTTTAQASGGYVAIYNALTSVLNTAPIATNKYGLSSNTLTLKPLTNSSDAVTGFTYGVNPQGLGDVITTDSNLNGVYDTSTQKFKISIKDTLSTAIAGWGFVRVTPGGTLAQTDPVYSADKNNLLYIVSDDYNTLSTIMHEGTGVSLAWNKNGTNDANGHVTISVDTATLIASVPNYYGDGGNGGTDSYIQRTAEGTKDFKFSIKGGPTNSNYFLYSAKGTVSWALLSTGMIYVNGSTLDTPRNFTTTENPIIHLVTKQLYESERARITLSGTNGITVKSNAVESTSSCIITFDGPDIPEYKMYVASSTVAAPADRAQNPYIIVTKDDSKTTLLPQLSLSGYDGITLSSLKIDNGTWRIYVGGPNLSNYLLTSNVTSTYLYATTINGISDANTDTNDPYLNLIEGNEKRSGIQVKGGTDISVKAKNGIITVGFSNSSGYKTTDHTYSRGSLSSLTFTAGTGDASTIEVNTTWLNTQIGNYLTTNNIPTSDTTYGLSSNTATATTNTVSAILYEKNGTEKVGIKFKGDGTNIIVKADNTNEIIISGAPSGTVTHNDKLYVGNSNATDNYAVNWNSNGSLYLINKDANLTSKVQLSGLNVQFKSTIDGVNGVLTISGTPDTNSTYGVVSNGGLSSQTGSHTDGGADFAINTTWLNTYIGNYLTDNPPTDTKYSISASSTSNLHNCKVTLYETNGTGSKDINISSNLLVSYNNTQNTIFLTGYQYGLGLSAYRYPSTYDKTTGNTLPYPFSNPLITFYHNNNNGNYYGKVGTHATITLSGEKGINVTAVGRDDVAEIVTFNVNSTWLDTHISNYLNDNPPTTTKYKITTNGKGKTNGLVSAVLSGSDTTSTYIPISGDGTYVKVTTDSNGNIKVDGTHSHTITHPEYTLSNGGENTGYATFSLKKNGTTVNSFKLSGSQGTQVQVKSDGNIYLSTYIQREDLYNRLGDVLKSDDKSIIISGFTPQDGFKYRDVKVNPEWINSRLCAAFTPFPGYNEHSADSLSAISILNRRAVKGINFNSYEQWRDNNTQPWTWRGNEDCPWVNAAECPQFWLSTFTGWRSPNEPYYHHRLTIFPTWFGQNLHEHLALNGSGISSNMHTLNTDLTKEKNPINYHYYNDFGIDTNWVTNNCVKTQIVSSWVVNNCVETQEVSTWIVNNCVETQEISTWFGTLPGRVGTYTGTTTIALNYNTGDFLTGAQINASRNTQLTVSNIPIGRGIIARFDFTAAAIGNKLRFGAANDDSSNILVVPEAGTYYIGFVRYNSSTNIECIGVRKILGAKVLS